MRVLLLAPILAAAACGPSGPRAASAGTAGLETVFDSTADTVIARVQGEVPERTLRTLVEELRIAPVADDTSLFTEVFEFDVDRAGRFWVFDQPTKTLFLFGPDGALLRRIGRQGAGPGEFNGSSGMVALGDSGLAVWDSQNARISFFSAAGDLLNSWRTPSGFSTSDGLVTDRSGTLFLKRPVTDPREGEILGRMGLVRLGPDGSFADSLVPPDLPVARESYLAVSPDGRGRSSTSTSFAPNYHWTWHPDGYFVVGHGGRYEILITPPAGKPVRIARALAPVGLLPEERTEERERITYNLRRTDPDWSWSGPEIPETKAPLQRLQVTRDGRIWAAVATASERIPAAELAVPRDPKAPVAHYRAAQSVYEVFSPGGTFLGRVVFPRRTRLVEADGDQVWALQRDADDLPILARLRIDPALPAR
jgi:hypothetical protein